MPEPNRKPRKIVTSEPCLCRGCGRLTREFVVVGRTARCPQCADEASKVLPAARRRPVRP